MKMWILVYSVFVLDVKNDGELSFRRAVVNVHNSADFNEFTVTLRNL